jgi:hypothetical protein
MTGASQSRSLLRRCLDWCDVEQKRVLTEDGPAGTLDFTSGCEDLQPAESPDFASGDPQVVVVLKNQESGVRWQESDFDIYASTILTSKAGRSRSEIM